MIENQSSGVRDAYREGDDQMMISSSKNLTLTLLLC
jgi:hypothetical protein